MAVATRLLHVALPVADLARSAGFYTEALGFQAGPAEPLPPASAALLGVGGGEQVWLQRGAQRVLLQRFASPGAPYPPGSTAADLVFQHCALVETDIAAAYARLRAFAPQAISTAGPQRLPAASGGATAFKFRDPDGHPLELIQFAPAHPGGIDHTAIAVADAARSIAFYEAALGLAVQARQRNTGAEQDALDGLPGVQVDVVALSPAHPTPHLELLGYRTPRGRPAAPTRPSDLAAARTVFEQPGAAPGLLQDPDGHWLELQPGG